MIIPIASKAGVPAVCRTFPPWESKVWWTTNLTTGFQPLESGIDYPLNSYMDTVHSDESSGFYEVEVLMK